MDKTINYGRNNKVSNFYGRDNKVSMRIGKMVMEYVLSCY